MTRIRIQESGPAVLIRGSFDDFSEFDTATENWDLDFRQLDRGGQPCPSDASRNPPCTGHEFSS